MQNQTTIICKIAAWMKLMALMDFANLVWNFLIQSRSHASIFIFIIPCTLGLTWGQPITLMSACPKLYSPQLHKGYSLQIHKQIRSKVPIFYFNGPKRPPDNFYVTCLLKEKSALNIHAMKDKIVVLLYQSWM